MSSSEVERFVSDLKTDDGLRSTLAEHASGVGSVVSFANEKGYEITVEEASAYIQAQAGKDLSDEQLDAIAGGKGFLGISLPDVAVVTQVIIGQTVGVATTVEGIAEVVAVAVVVVT